MAYTNEDWRSVVNLLLEAGFLIESADQSEGRIIVRVPMQYDTSRGNA